MTAKEIATQCDIEAKKLEDTAKELRLIAKMLRGEA